MKFEVIYCVTAKLPPATSAAYHTSLIPFTPSIIATIHKGMINDSNGNCLPAIAPIVNASIPDTFPATMIGIPKAPNATGAVLAIRHNPAAYNGLNPRPTKIAAVIATGAPNPAAPSKNAPNEKPIKIT